jgi:hypothetical protein
MVARWTKLGIRHPRINSTTPSFVSSPLNAPGTYRSPLPGHAYKVSCLARCGQHYNARLSDHSKKESPRVQALQTGKFRIEDFGQGPTLESNRESDRSDRPQRSPPGSTLRRQRENQSGHTHRTNRVCCIVFMK